MNSGCTVADRTKNVWEMEVSCTSYVKLDLKGKKEALHYHHSNEDGEYG